MSETNIVQECRLAVSEMGGIIFRNNVGNAYTLDSVKELIKAAFTLNIAKIKLAINNLRLIKFGLCVGSSDLIGIYRGKFLAIECKIPGKKPTLEQVNFINAVIKSGGIAGVCTCKKDVIDLLTLDAQSR